MRRAAVVLALLALLVCLGPACAGDDGGDPGPDAAVGPDAANDPTAAELFAAISSCTVIGGKYAKDSGGTATVDICSLPGAVYWTADMDIDCDGKMSTQCNIGTDPSYQSQTAATDSMGDPLDAATLPFVVFPSPSTRFDYRMHMIGMRTVVAVIYADRVTYAVAGDTGPVAIIGEASYAAAVELGIDPDPATGGTPGPVGYLAFQGDAAKATVIEDHAEAVRIGIASARTLLGR